MDREDHKYVKQGEKLMTHTAKMAKWMLALVIVASTLFPAGVFAAESNAVSLKFADDNALTLSLDDDATDLTVSTVDGSGNTEDVSDDAKWTSSVSTVATVKAGTITPVGTGTTTITAKYGDLSATKKVTVTSPYTALKISPDVAANVTIGQPYTFTATATKNDGSSEDVTSSVTWSTYSAAVATVSLGTVKGIKQGTTTITAKYAGLTDTQTIYVRSSFQGLMLTPEEDQVMFIGDTPKQIKAEVADATRVPTDVTNDVKWTSSNAINVTADKGLLTPWVEGTSTIKAEYEDYTKSFKVTVYKTMKKVEASVDSIDLVTGDSATLPKVTGTAVDGTTVDLSKLVEWSAGDGSIASVTSTKVEAESEGNVNLVGTIGDLKVTVPVSVQTKLLVLTPDVTTLSIVVGESANLPKVEAMTVEGSTVDVSNDIDWTSSSESLLLTGSKAKALLNGKATLKGTYLNKTVKVAVTMEPKIKSITVTPDVVELNIKKSKTIKAVGIYAATGKSVTLSTKMNWVSSNPSVATVKGSSVKALNLGTTTLTGSYQGLTLTVKVNVTAKLKKLTFSEKALKLTVGDAKSVQIVAEYDTGTKVDVTKEATWTSTKVNIATVTQGTITAVAKGTTTIKVEYGDKKLSTTVNVKEVVPAKS